MNTHSRSGAQPSRKELEAVSSVPRKLENPEFETRRGRQEITEDEVGTDRVAFESGVILNQRSRVPSRGGEGLMSKRGPPLCMERV